MCPVRSISRKGWCWHDGKSIAMPSSHAGTRILRGHTPAISDDNEMKIWSFPHGDMGTRRAKFLVG
jgi:hypothetical protein